MRFAILRCSWELGFLGVWGEGGEAPESLWAAAEMPVFLFLIVEAVEEEEEEVEDAI